MVTTVQASVSNSAARKVVEAVEKRSGFASKNKDDKPSELHTERGRRVLQLLGDCFYKNNKLVQEFQL